jgi:hypothetical protein
LATTRVRTAIANSPAAANSTGFVGDYRVIYDIRDAVLVVLVIEVGHRSSIY